MKHVVKTCCLSLLGVACAHQDPYAPGAISDVSRMQTSAPPDFYYTGPGQYWDGGTGLGLWGFYGSQASAFNAPPAAHRAPDRNGSSTGTDVDAGSPAVIIDRYPAVGPGGSGPRGTGPASRQGRTGVRTPARNHTSQDK